MSNYNVSSQRLVVSRHVIMSHHILSQFLIITPHPISSERLVISHHNTSSQLLTTLFHRMVFSQHKNKKKKTPHRIRTSHYKCFILMNQCSPCWLNDTKHEFQFPMNALACGQPASRHSSLVDRVKVCMWEREKEIELNLILSIWSCLYFCKCVCIVRFLSPHFVKPT